MPDHVSAPFRYTIPITRAIAENGDLFLEGEASGPEIDSYGTRIHPSVIAGFAEQIATRSAMGDPIPYRDTHGQGVTGDQPVMADFGELVGATVTEDHHLRVRVRLDNENPAARFLHKQIERGKRYGMSIGGQVQGFQDEFVKEAGQIVRTFTNVMLDHIANTSQPSWTPSLGTVLMRAVDRALEGENMDPEVPAPESPEAEGAEETTEVTEPAAEAAAEETAEETAEEATTEEAATDEAEATEETAPEVHTIEASALQPVADAVAALASAVSMLMATPVPATAVARSDTNDAARSVPSESPVTGNDEIAVLRTQFESLRTELATANDRIRQLEAEPAGDTPEVIQRNQEDDLRAELLKLDPHSRLRLGLEAAKAATNQ